MTASITTLPTPASIFTADALGQLGRTLKRLIAGIRDEGTDTCANGLKFHAAWAEEGLLTAAGLLGHAAAKSKGDTSAEASTAQFSVQDLAQRLEAGVAERARGTTESIGRFMLELTQELDALLAQLSGQARAEDLQAMADALAAGARWNDACRLLGRPSIEVVTAAYAVRDDMGLNAA